MGKAVFPPGYLLGEEVMKIMATAFKRSHAGTAVWEMEPKQKQHPVDMTGDGSKVQCCKEQYCIGTWNVRCMNQGKLEVVKQEMARVNVNISGISKLKWTGMCEFNSDDRYIYHCGPESLRRNGVAILVNKRVWNAVLGCKANHSVSQ